MQISKYCLPFQEKEFQNSDISDNESERGYPLGNEKIHKGGDSPVFELELSETIFLVDFSRPNQNFPLVPKRDSYLKKT